MSWINSSNATYKQNAKNDLSFYHGFSKTPVEASSTGAAATKLGNATTKSGHTVIGSEVWAEEIPWFGLVASKDSGVSRLSGRTRPNDLVKVVDQNNQIYKYIGVENATFTKENWDSYWTPITIKNGDTIVNADGVPVLRYYEEQPMQVLTTDNNAGITSNGYATRLFVNEETHTGQTSGGLVVSQFAAGTDNIKNGIISAELNPVLYYGTTKKEAGTHYYDYNVSGTILWNENVASKGVKISCFRYIGKTVTGQLSSISSSVKTHTNDISDIKARLGMGGGGEDGTPSVTDRVDANETALKVLLGLDTNDAVVATESIATTAANTAATAISTSLTGDTDGTIGKAIADAKQEALNAINAIQHFSVVVVPDGQTIANVTPLVENTIYLVKDAKAAEGTYIEYIAYKPSGSTTVVTEKIGSTAIDLSGYTTDGEHTALANRVTALDAATTGRVAVVESEISTLKTTTIPAAITTAQGYTDTTLSNALKDGGSIAQAINAAKEAAIANAKVTLTAGNGITIPNSGSQDTAFTISVDTDVIATKKSVDDLSGIVTALGETVGSNKTEVDGKISAIEGKLGATGEIGQAIADVKATADSAVQSVTRASGSSTLLTVTDGTNATISLSTEVATKTDAANAASTAITTSLNGTATGTIGAAVADAKKAGTDAMAEAQKKVASITTGTVPAGVTITTGTTPQLSIVTAQKDVAADTGKLVTKNVAEAIADSYASSAANAAADTIKSQTLAQTGTLTGMFSVATDGTVGTGITGITIEDKGLANAIADAKKAGTDAQTSVNTLSSTSLTYSTTADNVTLTLGGTVSSPKIQFAGVASTAALSALETKVDNFHKAGVSYKVLQTLPDPGVAYNGVIVLVPSVDNGRLDEKEAMSGSYVEHLCVNKGTDDAPQWVWEQIGTTEADLKNYVRMISEGQASGPMANQGSVYADITSEGYLSIGVASATSSVMGVSKMFTSDLSSTSSTTDATDTAVSVKSAQAMYSTLAGLVGSLSDSKIDSVQGTSYLKLAGLAVNTDDNDVTISTIGIYGSDCLPPTTVKVENGMVYASNGWSMPLNTNSIVNGEEFLRGRTTFTSWVSDLSNMTKGISMFKNCSKLTTFIGDLSSLETADEMFYGCTLDAESLEILADTLPTVTSGTIDIGASTNATAEVIATIKGKGWTLKSNGTAL